VSESRRPQSPLAQSPLAETTLRSVAPSVFLPTLLFAIGQGAVAPIIALTARDLGASVAAASLVVALNGIGQFLGDLPAGSLTARVGERRAMLLATVLVAGALVTCALATSVAMLSLAILCTGLAAAVWGLARQSYLTEAIPLRMRARALSTLAGTQRIGAFVGPFVGAGAASLAGPDGAYWTHVVAAAIAAALLLALPDVSKRSARPAAEVQPARVLAVVRAQLPVLGTLGMAMMLVGAVRASRLAVIPLWGERVGLDPATVAVVFGLSSGVDMLLFYPAGKVMDVFGRVWVAVPSMVLMAVGMLLVPLTSSGAGLAAAAMVVGVGNGLSSGIVMTLGADVSPSAARAQFLGAWRLCLDLGIGAGPLLLGGLAAAAGLGPAVCSIGGVGLVGAAAMHRWVPRNLRHST
jgi:MFS family permease